MESVFEPRRDRFVLAREQVSIASESHVDRWVSEAFHERTRVCASFDRQRDSRVAKIVESETVESGAARGLLPMTPPKVRPAHGSTLDSRKDEPAGSGLGVVCQVPHEEIHEERRQRHTASTRSGLGRPEGERAIDLSELFDHGDRAAGKLDLLAL
jgi:hypothetical protein